MYSFPLAGQNVSTFYGDIDNKLAVFQLNHVDPELIRKHKHRLISYIAGFMNVREDLIYYMETIKGSTLVLFSIQLIAYLKLFSGLGVQAKCIALILCNLETNISRVGCCQVQVRWFAHYKTDKFRCQQSKRHVQEW